jgi:signal transduction histidine kinase
MPNFSRNQFDVSIPDISADVRDNLDQAKLIGTYRELLEITASGAPIHDALNAVVRAARRLMGEHRRIAIFIFDPAAANLKFGAADGLDQEYIQAVDNFAVGASQPSCGQAAFIGDDVIVGDVATDQFWAPFLQLANQHGIRACWSFLLRSPAGRTLGTFALYHAVPCEPDPSEKENIRYFANIAALLIGRHIATQEHDAIQQKISAALQTANDTKDRFLVTVAHELRNPLSAMSNAAELARLSRDNPVTFDRAIDVVERQVKQMTMLVDDLLDADQIHRGGIILRKERMDVRTAVAAAIDVIAAKFDSKAQIFTATILPEPIWIDGDAPRLVQMICNLLNNAHKFTPRDGHIELSVTEDRSNVLIAVKDSGVGINREDLDRIFTLFVQVGDEHCDHDVHPSGFGLGLALVKDLAILHGGSVHAESEGIGRGSRFVLSLPRQ